MQGKTFKIHPQYVSVLDGRLQAHTAALRLTQRLTFGVERLTVPRLFQATCSAVFGR